MIGFSFTQNNAEYVIVLPSITYTSGNKVYVGSQELEILDNTVMASLEAAIVAYQPGGSSGNYEQGYADGEAAMESAIESSQSVTANLYKSKLASEDADIAAADATDIDGQGTIFSESYQYLKTSAEIQNTYDSGYSAGETTGYTSGYSDGEAAGETTGYANGQSAAASSQASVAGQYKSKLSSDDADIAAADATTLAGQGTIFSESYQYLKTSSEMQANYNSGYAAGETAGYTSGYSAGETVGETTGYANGQSAAASSQATVAGQYKSKLSSEDADIAAADATTLAGQGTIFSESYQYLKTSAEMQSNYNSGYSAGEAAGYSAGEAAGETTGYANGQSAAASAQATVAGQYKSKLASDDADIAAADATTLAGQGTIFSESYQYLKTAAEMQANYNSGYTAGETAGETTGYANGQSAAASAQATVAGQYKSKLSSEDADIAAADATTLAGQGTIFSESYQYLKTAAEMQSNYNSGYSAGATAGYTSGYSAGEAAGEATGYTNGYNDGYADARWKGLVIEAVDPFGMVLNHSGITIQYSIDRGDHWYAIGDANFVNFEAGQKIWLRGSGFTNPQDSTLPILNTVGRYKISGALTSLLDQTGESNNIQPNPNVNCDYQFYAFFQNDTNLISAENLVFPSNIVNNTYTADMTYYVFYKMFYGCTNMVKGPKSLPATALGAYSYDSMFQGCTSMTVCMDELPATSSAFPDNLYYGMFRGCSSLVKAPEIKWTNALNDFGEFSFMFYGCSSLNEIEVNVSGWDTSSCTNWVYGVSATGTFIKPSGTTIPTGVTGIPSGWTVINK